VQLQEFLNAKPLYYDEIDYTRMPRVYKSVQERLRLPKIIHIVGTNGKGTTGRFLASALFAEGFSVGHYSSPHILKFNERIWLNGKDVSDELLELAHKELLTLLNAEDAATLSYFEYTTLLAMLVYKECEYLVLEAGLGGEHDATAVFPNILTLITPIGMDHEAFLGDTVEKIATTKLRAIQKNAIFAKQSSRVVADVAESLVQSRGIGVFEYGVFLEEEDERKIALICENLSISGYLEDNLRLSIAALNFLKIPYKADSFKNARLFGRLYAIRKNILIDVGHNVLAAQQIVKALEKKKYILLYNSYKDKNYKEILNILRPIIEHIEIVNVAEPRIEKAEVMYQTLLDLGYTYRLFEAIDESKEYLVFGSFSVVETFLKNMPIDWQCSN